MAEISQAALSPTRGGVAQGVLGRASQRLLLSAPHKGSQGKLVGTAADASLRRGRETWVPLLAKARLGPRAG